MSGTYYGYDYNTVKQFDDAYWSAQPIPVQSLKGMDPMSGNLYNQAMKLNAQGYFIDVPIMVWQWDPFFTMLQRDGETYKDGLGTQTRTASTDIKDYPAVPAPTVPTGPLVDKIIGFGPYWFPTLVATQANISQGTQITENGKTFIAIYVDPGTIFSTPNPPPKILRWLELT